MRNIKIFCYFYSLVAIFRCFENLVRVVKLLLRKLRVLRFLQERREIKEITLVSSRKSIFIGKLQSFYPDFLRKLIKFENVALLFVREIGVFSDNAGEFREKYCGKTEKIAKVRRVCLVLCGFPCFSKKTGFFTREDSERKTQ